MENASSYESNEVIQQVKQALAALAEETPSQKRTLKAIGLISKALQHFGVLPILVGGQAVEIYTFGKYTTFDVDFVLSGHEVANHILLALGFSAKDLGHSHWYYPALDLPIEVPDSVLFGSMDKVTQIQIEDLEIYIIGTEDLILDRLRAAVHWQSTSDMEWAAFLLQSYLQDEAFDVEYLVTEAQKPEHAVFKELTTLLEALQQP